MFDKLFYEWKTWRIKNTFAIILTPRDEYILREFVKWLNENAAQHSVQPTVLAWCDKCGYLAVDRQTKICGVCKTHSG